MIITSYKLILFIKCINSKILVIIASHNISLKKHNNFYHVYKIIFRISSCISNGILLMWRASMKKENESPSWWRRRQVNPIRLSQRINNNIMVLVLIILIQDMLLYKYTCFHNLKLQWEVFIIFLWLTQYSIFMSVYIMKCTLRSV